MTTVVSRLPESRTSATIRWPSARVKAASTTTASVSPVTSTLVLFNDASAASRTVYVRFVMAVNLGPPARILTVMRGGAMVETGQAPIRRVRFLPPAPGVGDIEVNTLNGIRGRGGHHEFLTAQRLDFDLLMHIEGGAATHTVDFTEYSLEPGDVLWIRAGQVHHWGSIADVEGTVVMFLQHAIDDRPRHLIRSQRTRLQNHWPAD